MSWTPRLIDVAKRPPKLLPGHRLCAGCMAPVIVKLAFAALPDPDNVVVVNATGCLEVATTIYPYTSWAVPWIHNAFENAAVTAAGVEAAFKRLKRRGAWKGDLPTILVFGGDGGTVDIGLQSLSGALERGHKIIYILYDNEAYMNTGIQRSGATFQFAATTTSPGGKVIPGKPERKKPIAYIAAMHLNTYTATANPAYWADFMKKVRKAAEYDGPAFIHAISACPRGWRFDGRLSVTVSKLATDTCVFPLWEFDPNERKFRLTDRSKYLADHPDKIVDVEEWLKLQGRFRHLFKPKKRDDLINIIRENVRREWEFLLRLASI